MVSGNITNNVPPTDFAEPSNKTSKYNCFAGKFTSRSKNINFKFLAKLFYLFCVSSMYVIFLLIYIQSLSSFIVMGWVGCSKRAKHPTLIQANKLGNVCAITMLHFHCPCYIAGE
jgi:hypothetical protein